MSAKPQTARRRSRQEVEAAVREALLRLLSGGVPFKNLTVDELARAAGLSRTAFYFYFPGKEQALMSAASEVTAELYERADTWWHGEGAPEELVRGALQGILQVYVEHAALLRAAVELTSYSQEFDDFYKGLLDRFVRATADHLRREQEAGRLRRLDCDVVAESLVWMAERCNHVLIKQGRSPEELVDTMTGVWVHALYPDEAVSPAH
ncbi:MAG: TetR/AcrR family transcriptional regulator [Solirubrobacterales bacterium]